MDRPTATLGHNSFLVDNYKPIYVLMQVEHSGETPINHIICLDKREHSGETKPQAPGQPNTISLTFYETEMEKLEP